MKEWRKRPDIKEMKKESWKEYSTKNKEKLKEYRRNPKVKARRKNYISNRLKLDNDFKLKILLRARLGHAFKSYSKNGKQKLSKEYGIKKGKK